MPCWMTGAFGAAVSVAKNAEVSAQSLKNSSWEKFRDILAGTTARARTTRAPTTEFEPYTTMHAHENYKAHWTFRQRTESLLGIQTYPNWKTNARVGHSGSDQNR